MTENRELFLNTSPGKLFMKAALPGAISMLAATLFSLFDGMFVGQLLGDTAFAAVNLAMPFVIVNFSLADLIGVGSAVPISIFLGNKEDEQANNYFTCSCLMILMTGIFMGIVLYFGAMPLMGFMGADGELQRMAAEYLQVYAICSPLSTMTFALDNFLRISGKIKTSMVLNILVSVVTIILEFMFLFVLKMGVWGAALASAGAMVGATVIVLIPFAFGKFQLRFCKPKFSGELVKRVISSGSPNFLSNVAGRLTSIVMNMALLHMGGQDAVTIFGVMMYGGDIIQPLLYGVCDSLQPAIGYNYGAGRMDRVKSIEKYILAAGAAISAFSIALMMAVPELVAKIFLQPEETELLAASARVIRIYSLTFITRWFGFSVQSLFTALNLPRPATLLSVGNAFVFPLVLLAVLWGLGLDSLWLNTPLTSLLVTIAAALLLLYMIKDLFLKKI